MMKEIPCLLRSALGKFLDPHELFRFKDRSLQGADEGAPVSVRARSEACTLFAKCRLGRASGSPRATVGRPGHVIHSVCGSTKQKFFIADWCKETCGFFRACQMRKCVQEIIWMFRFW